MNVRSEMLYHYIQVFNEIFLSTGRQFLPEEILKSLLRYPLIQGGIIGYISTQFGVGIEYLGQQSSGIKIVNSSLRIEDFFLGAPSRVRKLRGTAVKFQPADTCTLGICTLERVTTEEIFPFRIASENALIRLIDVRFTAQGWSRYVQYAEIYGNRRSEFWSKVMAVSRAKDEILIALVDLKQSKKKAISISEYMQEFKQKTVLILGDYRPEGRERLAAIGDAIANLGYSPVFLDDIPDDLHYDLQQKAIVVGSISRFIIIDDSSKSGHLVEFKLAQDNHWVTIMLRLEGSESSFMTHGVSFHSNVISEKTYSFGNLSEVIRDSLRWAEETIEELRIKLATVYPWRGEMAERS
jgi:hypothetical protein